MFGWNFYLAKRGFLTYRHPYLVQFLTKLGDFNSHGCTHKLFTTFFVLKYPMNWRFGFSNFRVLMCLPTNLSTLCHYSSMNKFANDKIDRFECSWKSLWPKGLVQYLTCPCDTLQLMWPCDLEPLLNTLNYTFIYHICTLQLKIREPP